MRFIIQFVVGGDIPVTIIHVCSTGCCEGCDDCCGERLNCHQNPCVCHEFTDNGKVVTRATVVEVAATGHLVLLDEGSEFQLVDRAVLLGMVESHNEMLDKLIEWQRVAHGLLWRDWHFVHCNDKQPDTCKWCQAAARMNQLEEF